MARIFCALFCQEHTRTMTLSTDAAQPRRFQAATPRGALWPFSDFRCSEVATEASWYSSFSGPMEQTMIELRPPGGTAAASHLRWRAAKKPLRRNALCGMGWLRPIIAQWLPCQDRAAFASASKEWWTWSSGRLRPQCRACSLSPIAVRNAAAGRGGLWCLPCTQSRCWRCWRPGVRCRWVETDGVYGDFERPERHSLCRDCENDTRGG